MAIAETSLAFWPSSSLGPQPDVERVLYCYAHERLTRKLRQIVDLQEAAYRVAIQDGYRLGPLFVEEDESGRAMQSLLEVLAQRRGRAAVAVPHRGHLIPIGGSSEWQQLLEELSGHLLILTGRTP